MLILTRKRHQSIMIGKTIRIEVVDIEGEAIRLGIDAPHIIPVHRQEVFQRIEHRVSARYLHLPLEKTCHLGL